MIKSIVLFLAVFTLDASALVAQTLPGTKECRRKFEVYTDCGPPEGCEPTCKNPLIDVLCPAVCVPGCYCQPGYIRYSNGNCVPQADCFRKFCSAKNNEEYSECGANMCQATCAQPDLPTFCKGTCIAGCVCKAGFIRNANGECVLPTQCNQCPSHEVWTDCDFFCGNKYCDFLINPVACKPAGCTSGCICEDGYYRDANEVCVPENSCPV